MNRIMMAALLAATLYAQTGPGIAGTYEGVLTSESDRDVAVTIVIQHDGDRLAITTALDSGKPIDATDVKREKDRLTFRIALPRFDEPPRFNLSTGNGRLTGTVVARFDGELSQGKLDLKRK